MAENTKRTSAENITKNNSGDKPEPNLHPLKGTVKEGYKDKDSNKNRLQGIDKEKLEKQVHSATDNSIKRIADKIQNS
ncbi:hypothetical protein [Polaribacter porphyrae]|uniref:Uncharacterized protein n=1 Tax=Polaribacter porphyrae TaxID=1137780 RepID=A0A2S7WKJ4_9FLAO|nr:hypothetical protein [Polaribacter porphyrae]PQJ78093.1 hypothetical protein BTO18_02295 [Polaribacter porphyrae]